MQNDWKKRLGVVYSTNPDFAYSDSEADTQQEQAPVRQTALRVWLERRKGGKTVTVVRGFEGPDSQLRDLAALLRSRCATGGSVKDGEIVIQGDLRQKVLDILAAEGHKAKAAGA